MLSPDEIGRMLAEHRLYLETEYHQGHRANFASADGGIAQLGRHIALHPAWAQHHRPEDQLAQRRLKQRSSKEGLGAGLPRINSFRRGGGHPEFFHFPAGR
jgi:hypothetical protein